MQNVNNKGRGRPIGSVSYSEVTLGDLFAALGTNSAKVRVDKRWAEAVGVVSAVKTLVEVTLIKENPIAVCVE